MAEHRQNIAFAQARDRGSRISGNRDELVPENWAADLTCRTVSCVIHCLPFAALPQNVQLSIPEWSQSDRRTHRITHSGVILSVLFPTCETTSTIKLAVD